MARRKCDQGACLPCGGSGPATGDIMWDGSSVSSAGSSTMYIYDEESGTWKVSGCYSWGEKEVQDGKEEV